MSILGSIRVTGSAWFHLEASLEGFAGSPAYGTRQLRDDLARFIFLLGGRDGEPVLGPERQ
jgi:hypothetical protein